MLAQLTDEYQIHKGLSDPQIDQLIKYSQSEDTDLKKFTGDFDRFKDRRGFDQFSEKVQQYYSLVDELGNLAGIIWFDNFDFPIEGFEDYKTSFAIRLYGEARGKGLAETFTKICLKDFNKHNIWLSAYPENVKAISVYERAGFKKAGFWKEKNKDLMVLD